MRFASPLLLLAATLLCAGEFSPLAAQELPYSLPTRQGRYTPLNHRAAPGKVAHWNLIAKPSLYGYFQPVRVILPTTGSVTFYTPQPPGAVVQAAPAQAGLLIGPVYRLRIAGLPEHPGLELYPTIEVTDRLHPPTGREEEFPIPVEITAGEIEAVLEDRMVTKVIYLEEPRLATVIDVGATGVLTYDVAAAANLLDSADRLGRPVAILRMGGRVPDLHNPGDDLIGPAAPIRIAPPPEYSPPQAGSAGLR